MMIRMDIEIPGMITSAVSRTAIVCADNELLRFTPSDEQTCQAYMATYISQAGGYLIDPASVATCEYCTLSTTDQFLEGAFGLEYRHAYVTVPINHTVSG
jgi:ATP-binding cassette subfamily G (WHITE) protein 2 (SNQ2)